jgi:uracil-DNA glycosylase
MSRPAGAGAARLAGSLRDQLAALAPAWRVPLAAVLAAASTRDLVDFVDARVAAGHAVYPPQPLAALAALAPQDVRVVILGQDPYHRPGQAHGYAFSVPPGVAPPPSLRNIQRELARDCAGAAARGSEAASRPVREADGDLRGWSRAGVLLLNAVLTVEEGRPGSHARRGWEALTDAVIDAVAGSAQAKVFLLWGAQAQAKRERIAAAGGTQLVLCANHPSPLSARRPPVPFLGCGHFSRANDFLVAHGGAGVDWCAREP